uniref:Cadherin Y-type LIR-motif domain-containing protein n=1 Tax=Spermophilus dauricus TaxID=99837 RepID=A0A8C9Q6E5_SPEDA
SLQRTCTGTVIIDLQGSGWATSNESGGTSGGSSSGGDGGTSTSGDTGSNTETSTGTDNNQGREDTSTNTNENGSTDSGRPSNDCLLIYDIEGVGSPAGSVGCCSFIGEDLDESFLDTLGPKFKKLADISLGREIDSYPDPEPSWQPQSTEPPCPQQTTEPMAGGHPPVSPHFGTTTVISESTYPSGPGVQHPMPIPDPLGYGNVTMTESYTTSGTLKPSVHLHDNRHASNVVVTERVVGPISGADLHGMLDMPDLRDDGNWHNSPCSVMICHVAQATFKSIKM